MQIEHVVIETTTVTNGIGNETGGLLAEMLDELLTREGVVEHFGFKTAYVECPVTERRFDFVASMEAGPAQFVDTVRDHIDAARKVDAGPLALLWRKPPLLRFNRSYLELVRGRYVIVPAPLGEYLVGVRTIREAYVSSMTETIAPAEVAHAN